MSIIISGTPKEINEQLENIRRIVAERRAAGFNIFHPDMEWLWVSTTGGPCFECGNMVGQVFRGDEVPGRFENYRIISPVEIHPEYHRTLGWNTPCRCRLILQNAVEGAMVQLREDIGVV